MIASTPSSAAISPTSFELFSYRLLGHSQSEVPLFRVVREVVEGKNCEGSDRADVRLPSGPQYPPASDRHGSEQHNDHRRGQHGPPQRPLRRLGRRRPRRLYHSVHLQWVRDVLHELLPEVLELELELVSDLRMYLPRDADAARVGKAL
jgi:hypothetical protein